MRINWKLKLILLIIILTSTIKLYNISNGFILGEPDTITHIEIVQNFYKSPYPVWHGQGWYFGLPLYLVISFWVSLILHNVNLSLIVVSVLSSSLLHCVLVWFLYKKIEYKAALFGALVYSFAPAVIFYSRIGLIEMSVTALGFSFLFLYDLAVGEKNHKKLLVSSIFLSLAILTKYSALLFIPVPLLYLLSKFRDMTKAKKLFDLKEYLVMFLTPYIVSFMVILPFFVVYYLRDKVMFKQHTKASIFESEEFWGKSGIHFYVQDYLNLTPQVVSYLLLLLSVLGIAYLVNKRFKGWGYFIASFVFSLVMVLKRNPSPRYFFIIIPYFVCFASLGLYYIYRITKKYWDHSVLFSLVCLGFVITSVLGATEAYQSTNHRLVERTSEYLKLNNPENKPVFTTYWPNLFSYSGSGNQTTWLSESAWDLSGFGSDWPTGKNSLQILADTGGFVVREELYTDYLWREMDKADKVQSKVRKNPYELIKTNYQPKVIIEDNNPNYPFFSKATNRVYIYEIPRRS